MAVTPAVGLGILVVFLVGASATYFVLDGIHKHRISNLFPQMSHLERRAYEEKVEKRRQALAVAGGISAVLLLVLSFFLLPREWFYGAWIVLTIVGVVFGIATFFMNSQGGKVTMHEDEPPAPDSLPPLYTAPGPSSSHPTPPNSDNPYRDLLIKVMYDQAQADRLIEDERKFYPRATVDELCRKALARLE